MSFGFNKKFGWVPAKLKGFYPLRYDPIQWLLGGTSTGLDVIDKVDVLDRPSISDVAVTFFNGAGDQGVMVGGTSLPVPFHTIGNNNNFSIGAWVKTTAGGTSAAGSLIKATVFETRVVGGTTIPISFGIDGGKVALTRGNAVAGIERKADTGASVNDDTWHFICVVVVNDVVSFYVDGVFSSTATYTVVTGTYAAGAAASMMSIGVGYTIAGAPTTNYYSGLLSQVQIFNEAILPADMLNIMDLSFTYTPTLIACWPLAEGRSEYIMDTSSTVIDGQLFPITTDITQMRVLSTGITSWPYSRGFTQFGIFNGISDSIDTNTPYYAPDVGNGLFSRFRGAPAGLQVGKSNTIFSDLDGGGNFTISCEFFNNILRTKVKTSDGIFTLDHSVLGVELVQSSLGVFLNSNMTLLSVDHNGVVENIPITGTITPIAQNIRIGSNGLASGYYAGVLGHARISHIFRYNIISGYGNVIADTGLRVDGTLITASQADEDAFWAYKSPARADGSGFDNAGVTLTNPKGYVSNISGVTMPQNAYGIIDKIIVSGGYSEVSVLESNLIGGKPTWGSGFGMSSIWWVGSVWSVVDNGTFETWVFPASYSGTFPPNNTPSSIGSYGSPRITLNYNNFWVDETGEFRVTTDMDKESQYSTANGSQGLWIKKDGYKFSELVQLPYDKELTVLELDKFEAYFGGVSGALRDVNEDLVLDVNGDIMFTMRE